MRTPPPELVAATRTPAPDVASVRTPPPRVRRLLEPNRRRRRRSRCRSRSGHAASGAEPVRRGDRAAARIERKRACPCRRCRPRRRPRGPTGGGADGCEAEAIPRRPSVPTARSTATTTSRWWRAPTMPRPTTVSWSARPRRRSPSRNAAPPPIPGSHLRTPGPDLLSPAGIRRRGRVHPGAARSARSDRAAPAPAQALQAVVRGGLRRGLSANAAVHARGSDACARSSSSRMRCASRRAPKSSISRAVTAGTRSSWCSAATT